MNNHTIAMKSLFTNSDYKETVERLEQLKPSSARLWGTMEPEQMLAHCSAAMRMALGDVKAPRSTMGRLMGWMFKKDYLSGKPFGQSTPTHPTFVMVGTKKEFEKEKQELLGLMKRLNEGGSKGATTHPHTFFGQLTQEQWGETQWKHLDHHLRQFGV